MKREKPGNTSNPFNGLYGLNLSDVALTSEKDYHNLVQRIVFPFFRRLGEEVSRIGEPCPIYSDNKESHFIEFVREEDGKKFISVFITTPICPKPLTLGDEIISNVVSKLNIFLYSQDKGVNFLMLEDGNVVVNNEDVKESEIVLNTPSSLFQNIPDRTGYPIGNAARWINQIVNDSLLCSMETELYSLQSSQDAIVR